MSRRILKPSPDRSRTVASRTLRRSMKNPLMGSETRWVSTARLAAVAMRLRVARPRAQVPVPPPSAYRVPTTMSAWPPSIADSIVGRTASSCWRSASMTAMIGPALASMPSMQADASPRRPIRCRHRTRRSLCAIARTRAAVSSGESSSTKTASHPVAPRVASRRLTSSVTFDRSLNVGMTMDSRRGALSMDP
jgi:hypothetical protein